LEQYLVELYLPRRAEAALAEAVTRAHVASDDLAGEGKQVRYLRTIFVPSDEICFQLYAAQSANVVSEANLRAQIAYERIVRVVSLDRADSQSTTGTRHQGRDQQRRRR
jgi:hypothetical protein